MGHLDQEQGATPEVCVCECGGSSAPFKLCSSWYLFPVPSQMGLILRGPCDLDILPLSQGSFLPSAPNLSFSQVLEGCLQAITCNQGVLPFLSL